MSPFPHPCFLRKYSYCIKKKIWTFFFCLGKLFGFKLPGLSLLSYRKQSLPQEDPDAVVVDSSKRSDDSMAMKHFKSPTKESCSPSEADDTKALIQPSTRSPLVNISGPLDHSSPKRQWDQLYPDMLHSSSALTHAQSKDSICSIRRASSVHNIEGFAIHPKNVFRDRHASEGTVRKLLPVHLDTLLHERWQTVVYSKHAAVLGVQLFPQLAL